MMYNTSVTGAIFDSKNLVSQRAFKYALDLHKKKAGQRDPYFQFNLTMDTVDITDNFQLATASKCFLFFIFFFFQLSHLDMCHLDMQCKLFPKTLPEAPFKTQKRQFSTSWSCLLYLKYFHFILHFTRCIWKKKQHCWRRLSRSSIVFWFAMQPSSRLRYLTTCLLKCL